MGIRQIRDAVFFVRTGWRLHRHEGIDAIVAYSPFVPALAGLILKWLTGSPLIVQLPGHPTKGLSLTKGLAARFKAKVAPLVVRAVIRRADHIHLLYPQQLDDVAPQPSGRISVFHDFVPVRSIQAAAEAGGYLLFVGHPWHLKGVDVLIRAFQRLSDDFPDLRLKIVGFCPDRSPYDLLRSGNERIEFIPPVPHAAVMDLMRGCLAFVLPSRTEAMGRVLLEAMAAGKPIVASRVDGIPHYVQHGVNGLLFESEDVAGLADSLRTVVEDEELASRLGQAGLERVHERYSEAAYAMAWSRMVDRALAGRGADPRIKA